MIYALDGIAPEIDPAAWVADEAVLIGKVVIDPGHGGTTKVGGSSK